MPTTMNRTTTAVISLTILARRNTSITSPGCVQHHSYPRALGNNQDDMPLRGRHPLERRLAWAGIGSNMLGACDVFFFGALLAPVAPDEGVDRAEVVLANAALFVPYMTVTLAIGDRWGLARFRRLEGWLMSGRDPTPEERDEALRLPLYQAKITAFFWLLAAVVFTIFNAFVEPDVAGA